MKECVCHMFKLWRGYSFPENIVCRVQVGRLPPGGKCQLLLYRWSSTLCVLIWNINWSKWPNVSTLILAGHFVPKNWSVMRRRKKEGNWKDRKISKKANTGTVGPRVKLKSHLESVHSVIPYFTLIISDTLLFANQLPLLVPQFVQDKKLQDEFPDLFYSVELFSTIDS